MIGTPVGLIVTYLTLTVPLTIWVLSGYFATFPPDAEKAARVDGCTRLGAIWKVVLPMARPGIVAVWLLALMFSWNEMLFGVLIGANMTRPVQPLILQFSSTGLTPIGGSIVVLSIIFPIVLSVFFKNYVTRLNIIQPPD
jgi:multiple sugar transport system permease protein